MSSIAFANRFVAPQERHTPRLVLWPDEAGHFAQALVRGQPHGGRIALTALSDRVRELV